MRRIKKTHKELIAKVKLMREMGMLTSVTEHTFLKLIDGLFHATTVNDRKKMFITVDKIACELIRIM